MVRRPACAFAACSLCFAQICSRRSGHRCADYWCVCHNEKTVPDEWQARQATPAILQVGSSKHNAKIITRVRGPFHQSITAILTEEKREEKQFTKPTHVAVYLFRDLDCVCVCVCVCVICSNTQTSSHTTSLFPTLFDILKERRRSGWDAEKTSKKGRAVQLESFPSLYWREEKNGEVHENRL